MEPVLNGKWHEYQWLAVCGGLACTLMAFGIGANDVANSFATSVGSKTLKLWQAVIIAGIFEFIGAVTLGGEVTKTIASEIANVDEFKNVPELYMYGMVCALVIAGLWLLIATRYRLPVSTTHSIIGAIMGFGLVYGGGNGVIWNERKGDFPYSKGFLPIVLSWFFSPLIGGILAIIIFGTNRLLILRSENSTNRAIWGLPALLFLTFFVNLMFVLAKGAKSEMVKVWPCKPSTGKWGLRISDCTDLNEAAVWIAAACAGGVAIFGGAVGIWLLRRQHANTLAQEATSAASLDKAMEAGITMKMEPSMTDESNDPPVKNDDVPSVVYTTSHDDADVPAWANLNLPVLAADATRIQTALFYLTWPLKAVWAQLMRGLFYNVHKISGITSVTARMHANAEVFNPRTERVYQSLQIISACCVAFAHGSNDIANSVGPFAAIMWVYENYTLPGSSTVTPKWIFVMGAIALVLGLAMYGYHVIAQIGVHMLKLTPSRGFSVELAAGLTISLASFFGIPVSSTQIIVGCEIGCGLLEGHAGVNKQVMLKTFAGWILTIVLGIACCAGLFAAGAYAPSIIQSRNIIAYRTAMVDSQLATYDTLNATNTLYANDPAWWIGSVAAPIPYNGSQLASTIASQATRLVEVTKGKYVSVEQVVWLYNQAQSLLANNSLIAVGQYNVPGILASSAWNQPPQ